MKKFFRFCLTAVAVAAMALSCSKDNKNNTNNNTDEPGGGEEPPVVETKDYYVSPDGAGTKDGKSAENAFSLADFQGLLTIALDNSAPEPEGEEETPVTPVYADLDQIDGYTIHFADGVYPVPGLEIAIPGAEKQIELTFTGTSNAVLSGENEGRVLIVGDQVKLTIEGMAVKNGKTIEEGSENGGGIKVHASTETGKAALVLHKTVFDKNWVSPGSESGTPKCSGGAIWCKNGTVEAEECVFEPDNFGRNGGAIFTDDVKAVASFKNCTFKSHTFNTGGAANNSKGTQNFEGCTFDGCYTAGGTGGAVHANAAGCVTNIKNCVFKNCRAFVNELDKETPNNNKASGIISMQAAEVNIDGTTFENCYSSAGAVILVQTSDAAVLKVNNSVFRNNKGRSRAMIQFVGKSVGFLNNCVFYANQMVTSDWGMIIHGGNPSAVCLNNCTIFGNFRKNDNGEEVKGGNAVCLNNDGSIILTNSTIVESDDFVSIRSTSNSNNAVLVANSLVINTSSTSNLFVGAKDSQGKVTMKAPFSAYNSILGPSMGDGIETLVTNSDNVTDATLTTLAGGAYDEAKNIYKWNGPAASFAKMTPEAFETALKSVTVKNGNTIVTDELGTAFYGWLTEIGAVGKDALGTSRGAAWWPGAYQAN